MTRRGTTTTATRHRLYQDRPSCPTRHHNTAGSYRMGCRCPEAVQARRLADKRRRDGRTPPGRIDATGTARRLQAMMLARHRAVDIAAQLAVDPQSVRDISRGCQRWVYRVTADAVRALSHRWADRVGTSRITSARARAAGYVSLAAWDDIDDPTCLPDLGEPGDRGEPDEMDIRLVISGAAPHTALRTKAEKAAAVAWMRNAGHNPSRICQRLHISNDTYVTLAALATEGPADVATDRTAA